MTVTDKYVFFWDGEYSQWYKSEFMHNGQMFNCCEQFMMYNKAMLFNDGATAIQIINALHPKTQKDLGRQVKNFNNDVWVANREKIVYEGNLLKFSQNVRLKDLMCLSHMGKIFVEASPVDPIWGVNLHESDPDILDETKWKGLNLLGKALNKVQATLLGTS